MSRFPCSRLLLKLFCPTVRFVIAIYHEPPAPEYSKKELSKLRQDYEGYLSRFQPEGCSQKVREHIREYRDKLQRLHEELEAMQSDIGATNGSLTMEQMAREPHVNTVMVEYKLAALRLRGYNFGELVLPGYERVFRERL